MVKNKTKKHIKPNLSKKENYRKTKQKLLQFVNTVQSMYHNIYYLVLFQHI